MLIVSPPALPFHGPPGETKQDRKNKTVVFNVRWHSQWFSVAVGSSSIGITTRLALVQPPNPHQLATTYVLIEGDGCKSAPTSEYKSGEYILGDHRPAPKISHTCMLDCCMRASWLAYFFVDYLSCRTLARLFVCCLVCLFPSMSFSCPRPCVLHGEGRLSTLQVEIICGFRWE